MKKTMRRRTGKRELTTKNCDLKIESGEMEMGEAERGKPSSTRLGHVSRWGYDFVRKGRTTEGEGEEGRKSTREKNVPSFHIEPLSFFCLL